MNENKKWYAVYTSTNCEKKVSGILTRKNIENYCPQTRAKEPLFKSYVFVRIRESNLPFLKRVPEIINLVYWLNAPAVICDGEIEIIKNVLNEYLNVKFEKTSRETTPQQVRLFIVNNTLKIILPSLGFFLVAETKNRKIPIWHPEDQPGLPYSLYAVNS